MQTMLPKITDYWDSRRLAIDQMAKEIGQLPPGSDTTAVLEELSSAVAEHVRVLPDEVLVSAAIAVADDLYKTSCWIDRWDDNLAAYLDATASVFWSKFSERGFTLRYLVDNSFDNMERPLLLFPEWFASAGLVYVSPQVVAALLIQATEGPDVSVSERMPHFIEEARDVAESLIERCGAESRSFCLLDLDAQKRTFEAALQGRDTRGVLTVSRNEASEPGTKVAAWLPIELRPMVARATQPRLRVASQW